MNPVRWWRSRGRAARIDLYVRISLYFNLVAAPALIVVTLPTVVDGPRVGLLIALVAAHAVVCLLLLHSGIAHHLGRRARPVGWAVAGGGLTAAVGAVMVAVLGTDAAGGIALVILVLSYGAALATAVRPAVTGLAGLACLALVFGLTSRAGVPGAAGMTGLGAVMLVFLGGTYGVSVWVLAMVWELDRSRRVQAGLAVAEERLRFARDLHDVLGRTLSVVGLKAELAAQLARRGRDQAVDEMLEVRRIAQESVAELRTVVGGYRSADLDVELAGARSLLASAGVACAVVGDGATLPEPVQGTLGWVVREGTTNVLRHSNARGCTITLASPSAGMVALTMDNDGVPPDEGRVRFGGGLVGLAERIAGLGGTVAADRPAPDRFRLVASLPVPSGTVTG
ncbi:sensor histidine kinase [Jidongwangia harbinensis]|uniref:sensor histidine kinase n=1 Tax=Jidongwangia harbinensis TaxID=2878561 RepID=UPI001CD96048|nr:histidine kinase [Jidongwangia harbinensis]MCA2214061.1 histidine kinase [Jidongwangia harbinensis]